MTQNKVLLLGGTGYLGSKIVELKPKEINLSVSSRAESSNLKIDLTNITSLENALQKIKPKIIIHTSRIDPFDNNPIKANEITTQLVKLSNSIGAKFIYISTDAVFDGQKGSYTETDKPNPITDYGKAKLAAELAIIDNSNNFIIIRTASIYGKSNGIWDKRSLSLFNESSSGQPVQRFIDMYRSFTLVDDLAKACWKLVNSDFQGIINVAGKRKSFFQFSKEITKELNISPDLIQPSSLKESNLNIAPDTSLNTSLLKNLPL